LFTGGLRETVRQGAAVSAQAHIRYTGRRYRRVIALLDEHYDEMWVGGKASYKLGGIIENGGELVIYAPHLTGISTTHGAMIEKYGYAPLEQVREMVEGSDELRANLCVAAHLAHVSYGSRVGEGGRIEPRYRITLASAVPEEVCRRVKLGYVRCADVDLETDRRDPDTLVVEDAGRGHSALTTRSSSSTRGAISTWSPTIPREACGHRRGRHRRPCRRRLVAARRLGCPCHRAGREAARAGVGARGRAERAQGTPRTRPRTERDSAGDCGQGVRGPRSGRPRDQARGFSRRRHPVARAAAAGAARDAAGKLRRRAADAGTARRAPRRTRCRRGDRRRRCRLGDLPRAAPGRAMTRRL